MKIIEEAKVLKKMIKLIEIRKTGDTSSFAARLGFSRSKLYNLIDDFKNYGVLIKYDKKLKHFYFANDCKVEISSPIKILKKGETDKINGGCFASVHFFGQTIR